ncbi:hypothetical protein AB5I41_12020 [Sphingomonas sp. MMS24-JH45]
MTLMRSGLIGSRPQARRQGGSTGSTRWRTAQRGGAGAGADFDPRDAGPARLARRVRGARRLRRRRDRAAGRDGGGRGGRAVCSANAR